MRKGYKIVLTADRTLMSEYGGGIFLGFSACVPHGLLPDWMYFTFFCPSVHVSENGEVEVAPCGLRRIEASLLESGFKESDVIVAHPDFLDRVVGKETKVLGINTTDPLGIGPATTTFTQLFGGEAYMAIKFREIVFNPVVRKYKPTIIVGGPGAWQFEAHKEKKAEYGIDCVVIGEGEQVVPSLVKRVLNGERIPDFVYGSAVPPEEIPNIRKPTVCGLVEIARGCGRGCQFCEPNLRVLRSFPLEKIIRDVKVNLAAGRQPLLHAEDVLRYGATGPVPKKEKVIRLFKAVRGIEGVERIGISHFALSSVASSPELIEELTPLMKGINSKWVSGQTGIETASPKLMSKYMLGKAKPFKPEEWRDVVVKAFEILKANDWVPCATLIIGLPGEDERDVEQTIELVEELKGFKSLIVPLFFVSMGVLRKLGYKSMELRDLNRARSMLLLKAWKHNLRWAPTLIREYFSMTSKSKALACGASLILALGIRYTMKLIEICEEEYDFDILRLRREILEGKITLPALILKSRIKRLKAKVKRLAVPRVVSRLSSKV